MCDLQGLVDHRCGAVIFGLALGVRSLPAPLHGGVWVFLLLCPACLGKCVRFLLAPPCVASLSLAPFPCSSASCSLLPASRGQAMVVVTVCASATANCSLAALCFSCCRDEERAHVIDCTLSHPRRSSPWRACLPPCGLWPSAECPSSCTCWSPRWWWHSTRRWCGGASQLLHQIIVATTTAYRCLRTKLIACDLESGVAVIVEASH